MCLVFFWYLYQGLSKESDQLLAGTANWLIKLTLQDPRGILLTSMPALAWQDTPEEMESPARAMGSWVAGLARVDINPSSILVAQIPMLEQMAPPGVPVITVNPGDPEKGEEPLLARDLSKDTLVGIYNTHTGETYSLTDGTDRLTGKGGVVAVAKEIQEVLEREFAIRVTRSDKVHDDQYATSYLKSEKTAREMVSRNPKMLAMLDIHRDAGRSREESLVEVKGKKVAPILIIVGSDARRPFPTWKENYNFACRLASVMDELYPGLCQGVRVKEGRYNQFLNDRAILVEMGTSNNSLEEATASGAMLAKALARVIQEEIKAPVSNTLPEPEAQPEGDNSKGEVPAAGPKNI